MKLLRPIIVATTFLLICVSPALSQERDADFALLRGAAEAGDAKAQFTLANHYYRGLGVRQDYDQALALYRPAADQGFAPAQNRLGNMYEHGFGVPQSYGRAMTAYRMAAVQGNALAQFNLGMLYETGKGGRLDYSQALDWFRKAAEQGEPDAEEEVGYFYQRGFLGSRDYQQARLRAEEVARTAMGLAGWKARGRLDRSAQSLADVDVKPAAALDRSREVMFVWLKPQDPSPARVALAGRTFAQPFRVAADPRATLTPPEYAAAYAFAKAHMDEYSRLNATLNRLDAYAASAADRAKGADGELAAALAAVREKALALRGRLTADFTNDEDFIQRPGRIREDMNGLFFGSGVPPTAATRDYAARVDAALRSVMGDVTAFERGEVARANAALKAAGKAPLATSGAKRADVVGGETGEGDD